jgi:hypothetical protein
MSEVFAKLSKLCSPDSGAVMTTSLNITPVGTLLTDLKLGRGTIHLPLSMASTAPSPNPLVVLLWGESTAKGNYVHNVSVDAVAGFAQVGADAFFGPGTINGLKRILIDEAYGSVDIYSNGKGGFYTAGKDVDLKSGKTLMNLTLSTTALGDGDTAKTRTATITIIGEQTSSFQHVIGKASIGISAAVQSSADITTVGKLPPPGIVCDCSMTAIGGITNVDINLTDTVVTDNHLYLGTPSRTREAMKARIEFDYPSGNVFKIITSTGLPQAVEEATDWINAKSEIGQFSDLFVRATLIAGTAPTLGFQLGLWVPWQSVSTVFWENTLPNPGETFRTSTLRVDLGREVFGVTFALRTADFVISCTYEDILNP